MSQFSQILEGVKGSIRLSAGQTVELQTPDRPPAVFLVEVKTRESGLQGPHQSHPAGAPGLQAPEPSVWKSAGQTKGGEHSSTSSRSRLSQGCGTRPRQPVGRPSGLLALGVHFNFSLREYKTERGVAGWRGRRRW